MADTITRPQPPERLPQPLGHRALLQLDLVPRVDIELLQEAWSNAEEGIALRLAMDNVDPKAARHSSYVNGWRQDRWRTARLVNDSEDQCTTTGCVAGWVVQVDAERRGAGGWLIADLDLAKMYTQRHPLSPFVSHFFQNLSGDPGDQLVARDDDPDHAVQTTTITYGADLVRLDEPIEVKYVSIEARAKRVLGLTTHESDRLFDGVIELEDVRRHIACLVAEERARRISAELQFRAAERAAYQTDKEEASPEWN